MIRSGHFMRQILSIGNKLIIHSAALQSINNNKGQQVFREVNNTSSRAKTTEAGVIVKDNFIKDFFKKVGWLDHNKTRLKLTGYLLYESVPEKVDYEQWFETFELSDTFASWFAVTELHVWLILVRCMAEDAGNVSSKDGAGRHLRNSVVEALWADVANRVKHLEGANPSIARRQVSELSEQFQAALISYDEGLADDRVLAGALWRTLFHMNINNAEHLEKLVIFIRTQIAKLSDIPSDVWKKQPNVEWIRLESEL